MSTILKTDQYKFAMAEAGWPLREETFYYSHRKGGPHLLPVDVKEYIKDLFKDWHKGTKFPDRCSEVLEAYSGLRVGAWWDHFMKMKDPFSLLTIKTIAKGSWFYDRDPVFTVTGPSFLLSWLEPQILQLHYRIQVATIAANGLELGPYVGKVTCEKQKEIVEETLDAVRSLHLPGFIHRVDIKAMPENYALNVNKRVHALVRAVDGDASRIFEVGLRSATCMVQHQLALLACKEEGVKATSNTHAASNFGMRAIGTMGHEHVQRFGSDKAAYNAMADRMPGPIFCLLDTFDTTRSGIPAAFDLIARQPERDHAVRFDSGDIRFQLGQARSMAENMGINPRYCLEDGWNLEKTERYEADREAWGYAPDRFLYGFGGYIVNDGWTELTRDRVAAVWKITQSGGTPTMKFGSDDKGKGKESIPGKPILWRLTTQDKNTMHLADSIVAQEGEHVDGPYINAYKAGKGPTPPLAISLANAYSDGTKLLVHELKKERSQMIMELTCQ
jgi:nicotinic acid phosphoribosyltransferase